MIFESRTAPNGDRIHDGLTYAEWPGYRPLLMDVHVPPGVDGVPVVVWIHGGAFLSGDRRYLPPTVRPGAVFEALTASGIACATIDYRLSGEAMWPAQRDDVLAAIEYLRVHATELGIDTGRLGIWGESAGGHLALIGALTAPAVTAAVAWYPLTDVLDLDDIGPDSPEFGLIGGSPLELPDLAAATSPITYVHAGAPPILFVHGDSDHDLPASQSERMHERLVAAGADSTYHVVPGADHCFAGYADIDGLIDESVAFLAGRLR
jgi:acetyl esterase/lipase